MLSFKFKTIASLLFLLSPLSAQAGKWTAGIAGGGTRFMDYPASGHYRIIALPAPYVTYTGDNLSVGNGGIGWKFFNSDQAKLSFSVSGSLPSSSDDNPARKGMDDLNTLFEIGPKFEYSFNLPSRHSLKFNLPLRGVLSVPDVLELEFIPEYQGINVNPGFAYKYTKDWLTVTANTDVSFVSEQIHKNYYQVDDKDVTQDRALFEVDSGGLLSLSGRVAVGRGWDNVFAFVSVGVSHYGFSPSSDSPLHKEDHSLFLGSGFVWKLFDSTWSDEQAWYK